MTAAGAPLFTPCAKCGGSGKWTQPPVGNAYAMAYHSRGDCPDCESLGIILSFEGSQIVDLITRLRRKGRI